MRYRLQRHDGTDCSATMVPITVLRMVPIQRYRHLSPERGNQWSKRQSIPFHQTIERQCCGIRHRNKVHTGKRLQAAVLTQKPTDNLNPTFALHTLI